MTPQAPPSLLAEPDADELFALAKSVLGSPPELDDSTEVPPGSAPVEGASWFAERTEVLPGSAPAQTPDEHADVLVNPPGAEPPTERAPPPTTAVAQLDPETDDRSEVFARTIDSSGRAEADPERPERAVIEVDRPATAIQSGDVTSPAGAPLPTAVLPRPVGEARERLSARAPMWIALLLAALGLMGLVIVAR